jgi:hypothetical protein
MCAISKNASRCLSAHQLTKLFYKYMNTALIPDLKFFIHFYHSQNKISMTACISQPFILAQDECSCAGLDRKPQNVQGATHHHLHFRHSEETQVHISHTRTTCTPCCSCRSAAWNPDSPEHRGHKKSITYVCLPFVNINICL